MDRHPACYLRRSYVDPNSPGDISLEAQRSAVRKLAAADGHNGDIVEYSDWGISADIAKRAKRTEYHRLLEDMAAGLISECYAFDVDRLYRDPRDLIALQDAATTHRVRIVTTAGPLAIGDGDDPAAEGFAFIGAVFGRMELLKSKKRARAAREARRERGDRFGHPPYGFIHVRDEHGAIVRALDPAHPVAPIIAAYREAGSVLGTCTLLNEREIPAPKGGLWRASSLTKVLTLHTPTMLPRKGPTGQRIAGSAILSQLLTCHCGRTMTPNRVRGQLYCSAGSTTPGHGRYNVTEARILPWVKAEAGRLRLPDAVVRKRTVDEGKLAALEARRGRVVEAFIDGLVGKATRDQRLAAIDAEVGELRAVDVVVGMPVVDWSWPPVDINAHLRLLWERVELDAEMRPVQALWRLPAEYIGPTKTNA